MKRSLYEEWIPTIDFQLEDVYDLDNIYFEDGLVVILETDYYSRDRNPHKIKLHWSSFESFHVTQETYKESLWISADYREKLWTFYKATHSKYKKFIKQDSMIFSTDRTIHFVLCGTNLIVDVLSQYEPTIELVE